MLHAHGAQLVPVPVDVDGLQVHALPREAEAPLMVYVTPSHQFPLGSRLSIARRLALLEWAHTSDSLIIEDDYDSEFRYDAPPLPTLAGQSRLSGDLLQGAHSHPAAGLSPRAASAA